VPFHALYDGSRFLAERWATSVTAATPRLTVAKAPSVGTSAGLLGLGIGDTRTPLVADELRAVAATFGDARIAVGEAATSHYLKEHLPGPSVVHIASHGLHHPDNPIFSSIRLADRWITSAEILELDVGGALVTLSACESGVHTTNQAEPVGLAWAFLAAGASSVVVSQWVVDDKAASGLMPAFYRHVCDGIPVPEALRRAQLVTRAENPHPYYWGAFAHVSSPIIREWREQ
jgi:CHAT domain-containing protein